MIVRGANVDKDYRKRDGRIMFPTAHDITPDVLSPCLTVLGNLLNAGNEVLVVSKPHLECIIDICTNFSLSCDRLIFRFTIGGISDSVLRYWEPGAPSFAERLACLVYAKTMGFQTSVSIEPMIEARRIHELVEIVDPWVTDTIWIGKMNDIKRRVKIENHIDRNRVAELEFRQTDIDIRHMHEDLRRNPKIRWKDSIRKVIDMEEA